MLSSAATTGTRMDRRTAVSGTCAVASSSGKAEHHATPPHSRVTAYSKGGGPMRPSCFSASFGAARPAPWLRGPHLRGVLMRPQLDADLAHGQPLGAHRLERVRQTARCHDFTFPSLRQRAHASPAHLLAPREDAAGSLAVVADPRVRMADARRDRNLRSAGLRLVSDASGLMPQPSRFSSFQHRQLRLHGMPLAHRAVAELGADAATSVARQIAPAWLVVGVDGR